MFVIYSFYDSIRVMLLTIVRSEAIRSYNCAVFEKKTFVFDFLVIY